MLSTDERFTPKELNRRRLILEEVANGVNDERDDETESSRPKCSEQEVRTPPINPMPPRLMPAPVPPAKAGMLLAGCIDESQLELSRRLGRLHAFPIREHD